MDEGRFGDLVFSNISNNQSFGEHGGHLCVGGINVGRSLSGKIINEK